MVFVAQGLISNELASVAQARRMKPHATQRPPRARLSIRLLCNTLHQDLAQDGQSLGGIWLFVMPPGFVFVCSFVDFIFVFVPCVVMTVRSEMTQFIS